MPPLLIAGLALAALQIGKGVVDKANADKIHPDYQPYKISPYATEQMNTARQLFNGRMAGSAAEERNIDRSQATYNANVNQNASSGAQALALQAAGQARADDAYNQLAIREQQNKYGLLGNLNAAYQNMTNEQNKVYQSNLQKYYMDTNQKRALNNSGEQNIWSGAGSAVSMMGIYGNGAGYANPGDGGAAMGYAPSAPLIAGSGFNGPANTFTSMPGNGSVMLWQPPYKLN